MNCFPIFYLQFQFEKTGHNGFELTTYEFLKNEAILTTKQYTEILFLIFDMFNPKHTTK